MDKPAGEAVNVPFCTPEIVGAIPTIRPRVLALTTEPRPVVEQ